MKCGESSLGGQEVAVLCQPSSMMLGCSMDITRSLGKIHGSGGVGMCCDINGRFSCQFLIKFIPFLGLSIDENYSINILFYIIQVFEMWDDIPTMWVS